MDGIGEVVGDVGVVVVVGEGGCCCGDVGVDVVG